MRNWHSCLPVTVRREMSLVPQMRSSILQPPCSFVDFVAWSEHCGEWKMLMDVMLRRIFISTCFVFQELYRILRIRRRHFIWLLGKEDYGWIVGSSSCMLEPDGPGGEQFNNTSI